MTVISTQRLQNRKTQFLREHEPNWVAKSLRITFVIAFSVPTHCEPICIVFPNAPSHGKSIEIIDDFNYFEVVRIYN